MTRTPSSGGQRRQRAGWFAASSTIACLGLLWLAPVSPLAMSQADVALGQGRPVRAATVYDAVSKYTPFASTRAEALRRAAAVHAAELNDPRGARLRLERLLDEPLHTRERADVLARMGQLWLQERRPGKAAAAIQMAVVMDPESHDTPARMALAARAYGDAGRDEDANEQWARLADEFPAWRGRANLGRAELNLARRQIPAARHLFEDVVEHGMPDEQAAARLGISVCLEKLGDLDNALAAIDLAELPEDVRRSRTNALRARQAWTQ